MNVVGIISYMKWIILNKLSECLMDYVDVIIVVLICFYNNYYKWVLYFFLFVVY